MQIQFFIVKLVSLYFKTAGFVCFLSMQRNFVDLPEQRENEFYDLFVGKFLSFINCGSGLDCCDMPYANVLSTLLSRSN